MTYDDHNPSGAAPVRVRSEHVPEVEPDGAREPSARDTRPPTIEPSISDWQPPVAQTVAQSPGPQHGAAIPDDLRVPWGWLELALFLILGAIGSLLVYSGLAE